MKTNDILNKTINFLNEIKSKAKEYNIEISDEAFENIKKSHIKYIFDIKNN